MKIVSHFTQEGDRFLQTANACRYWPTGRGIFHNNAKTFLVWCGEEDHLRIISMQMGGNHKNLPFGSEPSLCQLNCLKNVKIFEIVFLVLGFLELLLCLFQDFVRRGSLHIFVQNNSLCPFNMSDFECPSKFLKP